MRAIKNALIFIWGIAYGACIAVLIMSSGNFLIAPILFIFFTSLAIILMVAFYLAEHWDNE